MTILIHSLKLTVTYDNIRQRIGSISAPDRGFLQ